jgi:hypothetical protein
MEVAHLLAKLNVHDLPYALVEVHGKMACHTKHGQDGAEDVSSH